MSHGGGSKICTGRKTHYSGLMAGCMCSHALVCCENTAPFPDALQTCAALQIWVRRAKSSSKSNFLRVRPRSQSSSSERCVFVCTTLCSQLVSDVGMNFTILLQVNPSRKADDGWTSCKYRGSLPCLQFFHAAVSSKIGGLYIVPWHQQWVCMHQNLTSERYKSWPFCPTGCLWHFSVCVSMLQESP